MKQRIATAVIGLTIFFAILALYQTIFLNISAAVIIFLALHEMFHVTGVWENKALSAVCLLFGCALPFFNIEQARQWLVYMTRFCNPQQVRRLGHCLSMRQSVMRMTHGLSSKQTMNCGSGY